MTLSGIETIEHFTFTYRCGEYNTSVNTIKKLYLLSETSDAVKRLNGNKTYCEVKPKNQVTADNLLNIF